MEKHKFAFYDWRAKLFRVTFLWFFPFWNIIPPNICELWLNSEGLFLFWKAGGWGRGKVVVPICLPRLWLWDLFFFLKGRGVCWEGFFLQGQRYLISILKAAIRPNFHLQQWRLFFFLSLWIKLLVKFAVDCHFHWAITAVLTFLMVKNTAVAF